MAFSMLSPTKEQISVLECTAERILVDGPPGTGKTTLTAMLCEKLLTKDPRRRVLVLTFTNNAADQIGASIEAQLKPDLLTRVMLTNYHSLYFRLIRSWGRYVGLPRDLELMSRLERRSIFQGVMSGLRQPQRASNVLPRWFDAALAVADGLEIFASLTDLQLQAVSLGAERIRKANQAGRIYFEDMAYYAFKILTECESASALSIGNLAAVIVDEAQDTNDLQWRIIKLIANRTRWICLGDEGQHIFRFAGAKPDRLRQFAAEEKATVFHLSLNKRNSHLVGVAALGRAFRAMALGQPVSMIRAELEAPDVSWHKGNSREDQFQQAIHILRPEAPNYETCHSTTGCIVPSNEEAKDLSRLLSQAGINHHVLLDEYGLTVGQDLILACLQAYRQGVDQSKSALVECIDLLFDEIGATERARPGTQHTLTTVERIIRTGQSEETLINSIAGIIWEIDNKYPTVIARFPNARNRIANNVLRLVRMQPSAPIPQLRNRLLEEAAQADIRGRVGTRRGITILTMHKAKGKEFECVLFFTPLGRGRGAAFGWNSAGDTEARALNLNLWHVSVTRTKAQLNLFYSSENPSQYLRELLDSVK